MNAPEPDPRTDGVGDGGERELDTPTGDDDIAESAAVDADVISEARKRGVLADDDPDQ